MGKRKRGRKKGSRNKGYFLRPNRGWFLRDTNGKFVPLCYEDGQRIRQQQENPQVLREAYQRYHASQKEVKQQVDGTGPNPVTVQEVVQEPKPDKPKLLDSKRFTSSGAEESRTPDLCIANAALSQLSYRPRVVFNNFSLAG